MEQSDWPFEEPQNVCCFTTTYVLEGSPILRVYHDFDGDWQFHGHKDQLATADVAKLVTIGQVVSRDQSLKQLFNLPCGWRAYRSGPDESWRRAKHHHYATYIEDGYYLEDALWLAQHRSDLDPPSAEVRDNLQPGQYVKLIFRFAGEEAEREDYQCERMWVLVREIDDVDGYVGTLENDPQHADVLECGDVIRFHPLHVMEVLAEDDEEQDDDHDQQHDEDHELDV